MTKVVSPSNDSPITAEQVAKFIDQLIVSFVSFVNFRLPGGMVLQVLETQSDDLARMLAYEVRKHVKEIERLLTYTVDVDRTRTARVMLEATGYRLSTHGGFVAKMPKSKGRGDKVDLPFS